MATLTCTRSIRALVLGIVVAATLSPSSGIAAQSFAEQRLAQANARINNLDTEAMQRLLAERDDVVLIDVRLPEEAASVNGLIAAGRRSFTLNRGWLEFRVEARVPDKRTPVVVYCGTNQRSPLAAVTLEQMGYEQVYNYADGFFAWRDAGLPVKQVDEAPGTMLFRRPVQAQPGVWSAIGATAPPSHENSGHNNNLSFIITGDGVVVVNAGDNYLLAQSLHDEIKARTDQPVKYVILENGQGHAMLGSNYWQAQGAKIIAHRDTVHEIDEDGHEVIERMRLRNHDKAMSTELTTPDIVFDDEYVLEMGAERIVVKNLGPAHSPGDIIVWLPARKLVISGDVAFHQRLLPVFEHTDTAAWIETWEHFAALGAETIIPGHGGPTTLDEVERYTVGYLRHLRKVIGEVVDAGGTLQDAYGVDQSPFEHLDTFDELARQNAGRVFRAMEFE